MPELQSLTKTRISGEILNMRFENPENGFAVVTFLAADNTKFAAIGPLAGMTRGQFIEADGYFEDHPEVGRQFRIDSYRIVPPVTTDGIARFLRHSIPGIGPKTAAAIVEKFGRETVTVLDLYPGRLKEVKKIGTKMAQKIIAAWKNSKDRRDDLIYLQGLGITPAYCARLFKQYGPEAVSVVRKNPYRLAEDVDGIGFLKADMIARSIGFAENSSERMQAAAVFALNEMIGEGHVCAPAGELAMRCSKLTGQSAEVAGKGIGRIAVDLRHNGGGNSQVIQAFMRYIDVDKYFIFGGSNVRMKNRLIVNEPVSERNRRLQPVFSGEVYVLTSHTTFSSAMLFAVTIADNGIGQIIGETPGNMPTAYGDVLSAQAPNSGLVCNMSHKRFFRPNREKDALPLMPDVEVPAEDALSVFLNLGN